MSRLQLALNVGDLPAAVSFYRRLFGVEPHKERPGYANFVIQDPPLKLVLFEASNARDRLNHLGVEVSATDEVVATSERLSREGLDVDLRRQERCCHATQDKVWVTAPDGTGWEVYVVTDDQLGPQDAAGSQQPEACCA